MKSRHADSGTKDEGAKQAKGASRWHFNDRVLILLAACATFVAYSSSLDGPFLFDDVALVKDNPLIRDISNLPVFFTTDIFAQAPLSKPISSSYRPLQTVSYAIDSLFWKGAARGYHLTNIFLHLLNVILVALLMRRLFPSPILPYGISLLFGVHPVNTQCVSYISGRADVLASTWILLSVIFYVEYHKRNRGRYLLLSAIAYLCALYTKEIALFVVPLYMLLYTLTFHRRGPFKPSSYAFHIAAIAAYVPMRLHALRGALTQNFELSRVGLIPRLLTSLKTLFIDARILIVPYDLHFGRTASVERSMFGSLYSVLTVCGISSIAFILYASYRKWIRTGSRGSGLVSFGLSWFLVSMAPLMNLVPLQVFYSENWLYLASIGIYCALSSIIARLWAMLAARHVAYRLVLAIVLASVFFCYGYVTVKRNQDYRDEIRFYLSSVKWRPNVKFYRVVGALYGERNDLVNAEKYLKKAIETNTIYPSKEVVAAYYNLGITYMKLSRYGKAQEAFEEVLASDNAALRGEARRCLPYIKTRK
jgi:hypothetical protein